MKQKRTHLIIVVVIVAVSCLIGLTRLNAQNFGNKATGPTKVAVCNLGDLFSKYQRARDMLDKLEKKRQEFVAEGQKRIAVLENQTQQLGGYVEGKPEFKKLDEKIVSGTIELEVWKKMQQRSILTSHMAMTKVIYQQMRETIAEVAKERGIDLVIQFDPQKIEAKNAQEWQMMVKMRQVLYSDSQMDITAAVLQKLNETYQITKPK